MTSETESQPKMQTKRRCGAQPGNTNALKHGFYSRQFVRGELDDLDAAAAALSTGLEAEIAMLRVVTRRVLEFADGIEDAETAIKLLSTLGQSAVRVSTLLKTQKILASEATGDTTATLSQALSEVLKELTAK